MSPLTRKLLAAFVVALITVVLTQDEILKLGVFRRSELASLDYRFQARGTYPSIAESSRVVIVEINDESFKTLPDRWPWPRSYYARLIRNLKAAGAKAIGMDIILSGADPYSPDNDKDLRDAMRETGAVILAGKMEVSRDTYEVFSATENFGNIFYPFDSSLGLVNVRNDADGVYRRYSPFWETSFRRSTGRYDTTRIPTFSFAVLNKYFGFGPRLLASDLNDYFLYAGQRIPKFDPTSFLINFYGPSGTFRKIKFADVIDDETLTTTEEAESGEQINTFSDPDFGYLVDGTFKNKIVLVGSTAPEEHDLFPVSIAQGTQHGDNLMYGVQIHANVIESVVRNEFLSKQSKWAEIAIIFLFAFLTFFVTSAIRSGRSLRHFVSEMYGFLFVLVEIAIIAIASVWFFMNQSYVAATISPMVAVLGGYIASTAYHYVAERKQRLLIKDMFSSYVNPNVVDELIANPDKLALGGERKSLTVLFSDIEGFTGIAEKMPSEELVDLLNEYFTEMTGIIFRHTGTLDKFFGDAVIAFWGAPLPQEGHALHACLSALEMQQTLQRLRTRWEQEGKPSIHTRIGINTGEVVVGNMGGSIGGRKTLNYTVIGDNVNIASRLEGANKRYGTGIMVSEFTYQLVKEHILGRELDLISVKGRSEPFKTFELMQKLDSSVDSSLMRFLELYTEGLQLYRQQDWDEANRRFTEALALRPEDYPTRLHIERAAHFKLNPPPKDWNGVFELTTK